MSYQKLLSDYIVIVENVIDDSLCDEILQEYTDNDLTEARVGADYIINKNIRNANSAFISSEEIINKNKDKRQYLDNKIFLSVSNCLSEYSARFNNFKPNIDTGYTLLEYKKGCFYTEHTDHFDEKPRAVSCSISLNDDFTGGEFGFFNRSILARAPKGSALMFPSNFMYPHEILPITDGVRYSIITWFS